MEYATNQPSNKTTDSTTLSKKERRLEKVLSKKEQRISGQDTTLHNFSSVESQPTKSKSELRAERRAKQESERTAKAAGLKKTDQQATQKQKGPRIPSNIQADNPKVQKKAAKKLQKQQVPKRSDGQKKVAMFSHLHQYEKSLFITKDIRFGNSNIHPSIIQLGLQYAEGIITGSNARCAALLAALCDLIEDYQTPPQKELARHLEQKLKSNISFLNQCRPLSVSMGSAIKYMKLQIAGIKPNLTDKEAKFQLLKKIKEFVHVNIKLAGEAISTSASTKISDGDVVLVFGSSSLINRVLLDAHANGQRFRVIVVDGRPKLSGLGVLHRLCSAGIRCSYVLVTSISYIMPEVTKVLLGAHGLLSNGYVMGSVGTALVAMSAKVRGVPVIVCCEAYKFCERVQTDSFVNNEIGDPKDVLRTHNSPNPDSSPLLRDNSWELLKSLKVLHLTYDVTPPDYIAMVVTELGMIPCTSVPVVLRVRSLET